MSYADLRGLIRAKYGKQDNFARALNMDPSSLSKKLNGHTQWTADEIRAACEILGIDPKDIHKYFFCPKS